MHYSTTDNWVTVGEPQMYHTALLQDTHWNVYRIRQFQGEAWYSLAPEPGVFFSCFVEEVFQSGGGRANCKAITWLLGPGWAPAIRDRGLPWSALRWTHQQRISRTISGSSSPSSWRLSVVDLQSYFQNHDSLSLSQWLSCQVSTTITSTSNVNLTCFLWLPPSTDKYERHMGKSAGNESKAS